MLAQALPRAYAQQPPSLRSRASAVALALPMVALLLLLMLRMGAFTGEGPGKGAQLVAINLSPDAAARAKAQSRARSAPPPPQLQRVTPPQAIVPVLPKPAFIRMSRADFAATDIAKLGLKGDSGSTTGSSAPVYGPGEGPGGVRLFKAEWVREPTDAELVTYLPRGAPQGAWATIACQTIDHYHVDNCQPLSEGPLGSGLARGLRLAAWQFLVRPPRIDGKPQIGAWVRIRFDFRRSAKSNDDAPAENASGG